MDFIIFYPHKNDKLVNYLEGIEELNIKVIRDYISEKFVGTIDLLFIDSDNFISKYYIEKYLLEAERYTSPNGTICYFGDGDNEHEIAPYVPDNLLSIVNKSLECLCKKFFNLSKDLSWNKIYDKYKILPEPEKREVPEFNVYLPWWIANNISTFEEVKEISINLLQHLEGAYYDLALINVSEKNEYSHIDEKMSISKYRNPDGGKICYIGGEDKNLKIGDMVSFDYDKITNKILKEASLKYQVYAGKNSSDLDKYMIPEQKFACSKNSKKEKKKFVIYIDEYLGSSLLRNIVKVHLEKVEEFEVITTNKLEKYEGKKINVALINLSNFSDTRIYFSFMHKNIYAIEEDGKWCTFSSYPLASIYGEDLEPIIYPGIEIMVNYILGVMESNLRLNIFTLRNKYNFFPKEDEIKDKIQTP